MRKANNFTRSACSRLIRLLLGTKGLKVLTTVKNLEHEISREIRTCLRNQ